MRLVDSCGTMWTDLAATATRMPAACQPTALHRKTSSPQSALRDPSVNPPRFDAVPLFELPALHHWGNATDASGSTVSQTGWSGGRLR